jgi:hypothetical protein
MDLSLTALSNGSLSNGSLRRLSCSTRMDLSQLRQENLSLRQSLVEAEERLIEQETEIREEVGHPLERAVRESRCESGGSRGDPRGGRTPVRESR